MHPFLGLELVKEINRDRLEAAAARRTARLVRTPLLARVGRRTKKAAPRPVLQVRPAPVTGSAAPMGCTA